MALSGEQKRVILKKYQRSQLDTGSSEVQIALLTNRINQITPHFVSNKKDNHGRRGLLRMVHRRRKLLDYLHLRRPEAYTKLVADLGLRK